MVSRFLNDPDDGLVEIGIAAAEAGDLERALKPSERITEPVYRARVLIAAGRTTAGSRDPARTPRLARQACDAIDEVPYLHRRVALSADTADFLLRAGQEDRAHAVLIGATNMARRGQVPRAHTLVKLAVAAHRSGHRADAARLVHRAEQAADASVDYARVRDRAAVAEGLHHTGHPTEADELLRRVIHESRTLANRAEHAAGLKRVAEAFGRIGKPARAAELVQEIRELVGTAESPSRRCWDTYAAAGALLVAGAAATGDVTRAAALLEEISAPVPREAASPAVVRALSRVGARATARTLADALTSPDHRGKALAAIAQTLGPCPQERLVLVEALCCVPHAVLTPKGGRFMRDGSVAKTSRVGHYPRHDYTKGRSALRSLTGSRWVRNGGVVGGSPTLFDHARTLRDRYGPGPWPGFGDPLPDASPNSARLVFVGGGEDALLRRAPDGNGVVPPTGVELADHLEHLLSAPTSGIGGDEVRGLHDLLATCSPIEVADELSSEVRHRGLPSDGLRGLGRQLARHGTHRAPVKIGLVLLGLGGDIRDRDLLHLLGTLDELTLYAAVALHRSQPDGDLQVHVLAQRVAGWGRIQAVRTLRDTTDPGIRAWLLREGFRNSIMGEYLAHLAATTGDLHGALSHPYVDTPLLDGAGGILAAMADGQGGPAPGLADYPPAVPVLLRYADLVQARTPTIAMLSDLISITMFFRHPPQELPWTAADIACLTARYEGLLHEPRWHALVLDHLADPRRPDFHLALRPADVLHLCPTAQLLARLETEPSLLDPTWVHALRNSDRSHTAHIFDLAARRLATTPSPERDHALVLFAHLLRRHPGHGWPLLRSALTSSTPEARRTASATLAGWPADTLPQEAADLLRTTRTPQPDNPRKAHP
ncbi:hypothetical protein ACIRQQ_43450 [Streptomyces fuscichromogenes]|uniref:hypothetical protein n=1 Tax=Streptomyces fuscichromogenes TaxID=1324013 RepID=UPI00380BE9C2